MTSATNSVQPNENYAFDGVGNRTTSHLSANYNYQPFNKLTSSATASYTYDNNGNLLAKTDSLGTTTFTWNEENQLTQVSLPGGLTVNHKYDGLGRRIQRTASAGANERYVYDGYDVLLDLNADWSVANTYLNAPGIDNHLRQTSTTMGVSYFLTDQLGSTSGLTDASGTLAEQIVYDSFGNSTGSGRTRYGYTGRERDPDTASLYYRGRWLDPQVGRFLSEDPIGFLGRDINLYGYVHNDPLRMIDPSGLRRCHPLLGALAGGLLGGGGGAGVGSGLGALAGGAIGAAGGTFVIPGFGTIAGGGGGIPVGASAGAFIGSAIGIGVGVGVGIDYCNGDDPCDTTPKVRPFPKPEPRPTPLFPPLPNKPGEICRLKEKQGLFCTYVCKDGFQFQTFTDTGTKDGNCPAAAARGHRRKSREWENS